MTLSTPHRSCPVSGDRAITRIYRTTNTHTLPEDVALVTIAGGFRDTQVRSAHTHTLSLTHHTHTLSTHSPYGETEVQIFSDGPVTLSRTYSLSFLAVIFRTHAVLLYPIIFTLHVFFYTLRISHTEHSAATQFLSVYSKVCFVRVLCGA